VVCANVLKEGEMYTRKESKEKKIVVDEEGSTSLEPIPNLKTHQIVKERKCAYVFRDGVA
jgi:hypothetical protein